MDGHHTHVAYLISPPLTLAYPSMYHILVTELKSLHSRSKLVPSGGWQK